MTDATIGRWLITSPNEIYKNNSTDQILVYTPDTLLLTNTIYNDANLFVFISLFSKEFQVHLYMDGYVFFLFFSNLPTVTTNHKKTGR